MNKIGFRFAKQVLLSILVISLLFSLPNTSFAASNETLQVQNVTTVDEAFLYALAPDDMLPFIYNGHNPAPWREIDTTDCVVGRLYVYNENNDSVISVVSDTVLSFTATKDYLFYVTEEEIISAVDYSGVFAGNLYQSARGAISDLSAFGNVLYFIEGGQHAVIFNTEDQSSETIISRNEITSLYMFDFDKIIWRDSQWSANYFNISSQENIGLANEYTVNCLVNSREIPNEQQDLMASTYALTAGMYNDVTFPLPEYPAASGVNWEMPTVQSYFNRDYGGSNQCDGFARYAHDRFWHLYDENSTITDWFSDNDLWIDYCGADFEDMARTTYEPRNDDNLIQFNNDQTIVEDFFNSLHKGALIRYVSKFDETPYNGNHTIVFAGLSADGQGIYAYEANQDHQNGVGYQKYTFSLIADHYATVFYYVDHSLRSTGVSANNVSHLIYCRNCDAYLRRSHDIEISYTTTKHTRSCTGCDWTNTGIHTYVADVCTVCGYAKKGNIIMGNSKHDALEFRDNVQAK